MHYSFFRARRLPFLLVLVGLIFLAACGERATPTRTRIPTRVARVTAHPTKVARVAPTDTPRPTQTKVPTRTPVPTQPNTPTPTETPVKKSAQAPTKELVQAAAAASNVPATALPTPLPTATPPPKPAADSDIASSDGCDATGGGDYGVLGAGGWEGRDPRTHPDLNLGVRGYKMVNALQGLVDYDGETDGDSPQLWGLFADRRTPEIAHTYQVYDWDWGSNSRGDLIQDFDVTMVGFRVSNGETIYTPDFGHEIGEGYVALVLYADTKRITLKYTGEDNVIDGYTLHLEGLCVYANLLNLYNTRNAEGRGALPALRPGQPIGYVPGIELGVAIRDRGAFLDPRSRKDWWKGR